MGGFGRPSGQAKAYAFYVLGVLGEAASSLPNRMLTLSADNIEMSKINALDALKRKKSDKFFNQPLQVLQSHFE